MSFNRSERWISDEENLKELDLILNTVKYKKGSSHSKYLEEIKKVLRWLISVHHNTKDYCSSIDQSTCSAYQADIIMYLDKLWKFSKNRTPELTNFRDVFYEGFCVVNPVTGMIFERIW